MPLWLQHLLVLLVVAACVAYVLRGVVRTLRGAKGGSKLGACCAKGCDAAAAPMPSAGGGQQVVFFPAEMLRKRQ